MRHLYADRGGETVTHCAQTTRSHPTVGVFKAKVLCRPHLVLTDFCRDVAIVLFGQFFKALQGVLRLDDLAVLLEVQAFHVAPFVDLIPPLGQAFFVGLATAGFPDVQQILKHMGNVAQNWDINVNNLVDRRRIDIDMRLF